MKEKCPVVLDLIPLVKDQIASEESVTLVQEHIEECAACRAEFDAFQSVISASPDDRKILKKIRARFWYFGLIGALISAVVGVFFSDGFLFIYNALLMPFVGVLGYFSLKQRWYLTPLGVLLLTTIWNLAIGLFNADSLDIVFGNVLTYGILYTIFVLIGQLLAALLRFAFTGKVRFDSNCHSYERRKENE